MSNKSHIFGQIVEHAKNIVERYQSDLYHDAIYLSKFEGEFIIGLHENGTHIFALAGSFNDEDCGYVYDNDLDELYACFASIEANRKEFIWLFGDTISGSITEIDRDIYDFVGSLSKERGVV